MTLCAEVRGGERGEGRSKIWSVLKKLGVEKTMYKNFDTNSIVWVRNMGVEYVQQKDTTNVRPETFEKHAQSQVQRQGEKWVMYYKDDESECIDVERMSDEKLLTRVYAVKLGAGREIGKP